MIHNRKNLQPTWQIFLTLVLISYMVGWNYSNAAAAGTTYYVDNTNLSCSDTGSGTTTALPFCTIGKGANIAVAGDTVQVLAGSYAETISIPKPGSLGLPITYSAASGVTVSGNGSATGSAFRMSTKSYIVVDGFTITDTVDYGIYVFGSNNITISNNHVSSSGSPASGSTRVGIYINSTTNSTISGNTSDHNSNHGILLTNGSNNNLVSNNISFANAQEWQRDATGIRLDASNNNTILHNIAYANEDSGMNFYLGSSGNFVIGNVTYGNGDHGFDFSAAPNNMVIGNTVQGNVTSGINFEGTLAPGSGGATVANNIMVDNGLLQQVGGGTASGQSGNLRFNANSLTGNTLDYNLYYLSSGTVQIGWGANSYATLAAFQGAVAGQEIHGVQADPFFIATAPVAQRPAAGPFNVAVNVGDYHLTAGSPAIDSANSDAPNEPTFDVEGNARVDDPFTTDSGAGTRTYDDRGAYEFQPTVGAALPSVTTQAVTNITQTSVTGNGNITDLGVPNPTQHGVVWSTSLNPTIADNKTTDGPVSATGAFTSSITGLTPGTLYHVRAYAWNSAGISYGDDVAFTSAYTIYYVDNTNGSCSDTGSGTTTALPFCTIGKGASIAFAGDTVRVLAGSYAETISVPRTGSSGLPITYSAASGVTMSGNGSATGSAFRMSTKSYIVVDGFTITDTVDYGIFVFGSNNITISNNHVSYSGSPVDSTTTRSGIYINSTTNSTISGNTSDHNSNHGILLTNGSHNNLVSNNLAFANAQEWQRDATGIRLDASNNNTILHNIAYANEDTGLNFYTGSSGNLVIGNLTYGNGDHGIDFNAAPNNTVIGNTVQGNVTSGINFEGDLAPGSGGATVANNIMVDNGLLQQVGGGTSDGQAGNLRFDAQSLTGNTLDYNLYDLNSGTVQIRWGADPYATLAAFQSAVAGQEIHGVQADPFFIAPAPVAQRPAAAPFNVAVNAGDYHLNYGSPAIDSANSDAPNEPTLDIEGNARIDDPFTTDSGAGIRSYDDRGAYEFQLGATASLPAITTQAVTAIGTTTAMGNGNLTDLGVPNPTAYGVVWSLVANPTTADSVSDLGATAATGAFTAPIIGLTPNTLYHVRAFATNTAGTAYGEDVTFTTQPLAPTVTTQAVTDIVATTATGNGNITDLGVPNPTAYGVVWSLVANPTTADSVSDLGAAPATGAFTAPITGLTPNTLYHVRAFATNTAGTVYGEDVTFTTQPLAPTVTTQAVTDIAATTATGNGNLTDLGVSNPTAYGVVWSLVANPTTADSVSDLGAAAATGAFTAPITGLTPNTLYHVRAFATNTAGTAYGEDVTFTTYYAVTTTTSATNAGTGANVTGVGTITWTNPGNLTADDTSYATAALNNATSHFLQSTNYGFAIPADATINGIVVTIGRFENATGRGKDVRDNVVSLIKGGAITGINAATSKEWPTGSPVAATYGSTSDLWGTTWTPADINASNFGVALSAISTTNRTASVDYMQISVTYTALSLPMAPTVTTQAVTALGTTTATGNGNITDLGVPNPTQYGVVWDTAANPTIDLATKTAQGVPAGTGAFTSNITGLTPGVTYHVRAYATNSVGTSYGGDVSFISTISTVFYFANTTVASNSVTNPDNGWISDNQYATFDANTDTADYGFLSLDIPSNAIITGIEVIIEGKWTGGGSPRNLTAALWNTSALNPDAFTAPKIANLGTSDTNQTLGGPTDTWGTTWTPDDFAAGIFKIRVGVTSGKRGVALDAVSIRVYYSLPTP